MSMSDPIADMITRVRNALMARHDEVELPLSKVKTAIAEVLKSEGYVDGYSVKKEGPQGTLTVQLKYKNNHPVIQGMKRVSKPSLRVYVGHDEIPKVLSGLGINILSTNKGVMSDRVARKQKVGGELLCAIW